MEINNFTYLGLLLLSIAVPLIKSFEQKIQFYRKLKYIIPAIFITAVPFLIWDVIFEKHHIWQFNPDYTLGWRILGLPIEEWLFFFVIPYACFFIYEVVKYFTGKKDIPYIKIITLILSGLFLLIGILFSSLDYTFINFILAGILLVILMNIRLIVNRLSNFYKGYLVSLLPFFLVNGVLTKMPVVSYDNGENLSLRIYTIPIEDMVYLLSLLFINFAIYEIFRHYDSKKQFKIEGRDR
jgi:lycopene cyclase domain-containing protein